jgi:phospholipase C
MARKLLPLLLSFAAGCAQGSGPEADLQYIKQARSLGAEWALVNEQANRNGVTPTYVRSMHQWLRSNLKTASTSLTRPDSRYGEEIQALLAQPDDAAPEELRAHAEKLKQIEDELESA